MKAHWHKVVKSMRGAALLEYALLVSLIAVLSIYSVMSTGVKVEEVFCRATNSIKYAFGKEYDPDCLPFFVADETGTGSGDEEDAGTGNTEGETALVIPENYEPIDPNLLLAYEVDGSISIAITGSGQIDWGDGSVQSFSTGTSSHNYASPGRYIVNLDGDISTFQNKSYDALVEVISFGEVGLNSLSESFKNSTALTKLAALPPTVKNLSDAFNAVSGTPDGIEVWNTSNVTNFSSMFEDAVSFDANISLWDVSSGTNFYGMFRDTGAFNTDISQWDMSRATHTGSMFYNASAFNQDLSQWEVGGVSSFSNMFYRAAEFTSDLSQWDVSGAGDETAFYRMFAEAESFTTDFSEWCVPNVTEEPGLFSRNTLVEEDPLWGFCGIPDPDADALTLVYDGSLAEMRVSLNGKGYVHWGDGSVDLIWQGANITLSHDYDTSDEYTVKVSGDVTTFRNEADAELVEVLHFNEELASLEYAFWDADNLRSVPATLPPSVYTLNRAFYQVDSAFTGVSGWNTENVSNFREAFRSATTFNEDLSGWDVSGADDANDFAAMFNGATAFSSNLSDWCVSSISSTPTSFSVSSGVVHDPVWGFCGTPDAANDALTLVYNGSTASINVISEEKFYVHWGDGSVDAYFPPSSWSSGTLVSHDYASSGTYTVTVSDRTSYPIIGFQNRSYDELIAVTQFSPGLQDLNSAFARSSNLSSVPSSLPGTVHSIDRIMERNEGNPTGFASWDVSNVNNFEMAFRLAENFNQDISGWDVTAAGRYTNGNVRSNAPTFMQYMFSGASAFNRDLSGWCVSHIATEPTNFAASAGSLTPPNWGAACQ